MLENNFLNNIYEIFPNNFPNRVIIAVSGGVDSMALLFLSLKFCQKNNIELIAVTIDHKMRKESAKEAKFVAKICQENHIEHHILNNNLFIPKSNIESNLREIRYNLLSDFAQKYDIENILVAHHQQDIAENFLIRLFRGSGIDGLSSMKKVSKLKNINLVRPLLDCSKEDLRQYLSQNNIGYIEDKTNEDQKFLRNKIRAFLNEFDNKEIINQRISRASANILENRKIIEKLIDEKSHYIYEFCNLGYFLLKKENFKKLEKELSLRYLNKIFNYFNGNFYKSRLDKIENIYGWIMSDLKYKAKTFNGAVIEDFDENNLIIYREKSKIEMVKITEYEFIWDNRFKIQIPQKYDLSNLEIGHLDDRNFNLLLKDDIFYNYRKVKNPLKKVFYTIPVIKNKGEVIFIYEMMLGDIDVFLV